MDLLLKGKSFMGSLNKSFTAGAAVTERADIILRAVVNEYIRTAEPVSSRAISARYSLSPATIRNSMAELERHGYLTSPHTSAGRVPTLKCFRYYLDSLLELSDLLEEDKDTIHKSCLGSGRTLWTDTTRALSGITGCAGLLMLPDRELFKLKSIRLVRIDSISVMVVLVFVGSEVRTRVVRLKSGIENLDLDHVSNYLSAIGAGLTLPGLKCRLIEEMKKEKNLYDEIMKSALALGTAIFNAGESGADGAGQTGTLYVEGKLEMLAQPEFRDNIHRMKRIFAAFEEKSLLLEILEHAMEENAQEGAINISLGAESSVEEFEDLAIVTAPYFASGIDGDDCTVTGRLGVIGPLRMDYSRVVPLVAYTAGLLGKSI